MNPPLLAEMISLVQWGIAELPATPDYPSQIIRLCELEWTDEHHCFIGGPEFKVIRIPKDQRITVVPRYEESVHGPKPAYDVDYYHQERYAVVLRRRIYEPPESPNVVLWQAIFMCHSNYKRLRSPHKL